jgi:uncharacterized membrane protein
MDEVVLLSAIVFGGVILVAPLAALFLLVGLRKRHAELKRQVEELEQRGARADWWIGELARRADAFRGSGAASPADASPRPPIVTAVEASPRAPIATRERATPAGEAASSVISTVSEPARAPASAGGISTSAAVSPARKTFDFEKLVGVRLFAWLGGLGLFIGAAFFLEYSIEHDLISPPLRIGIGLVGGALAVLVGDYVRGKADRSGQALGGAGIATLYASLFAGHTLYHLLPATVTFAAMALVTALAGLIAVRRDAFVLAVIGLIGGFATPVLLSTGEDHRYALFAYIGVLDAAVLFVAAKRKWTALTAMALVATTIIYVGWAAEYLDSSGVPFALGVAAALSALFAIGISTRSATPPLRTPLRTGVFAIALASPLIAAMTAAGQSDLRVSPTLLSGYLCLLLAGTFVMAGRFGAPFSLEIGAGLAVFTWAARIAPDVLGEDRVRTLLVFSGPPLLLLLLWLLRRRRGDEKNEPSLRRAAAIALGGSFIVIVQALPLEAPTGSIAPFALYAAAHVVGLIVIGLTLASPKWLAIAQALWIATLVTLADQSTSSRLGEFVPFILVPMLVFFGLPLVTPRARGASTGFIAGALALVTHFAVLYGVSHGVWPDVALGIGAVVAGALALGMLSFARPLVLAGRPSGVVATLGAVTLAFLTAAVPITLSKQWITVAWALEAAAVAWLYRRVVHKGLLVASALLAAFTLVRLVANPWLWEYHPRSGIIVLNWYLYTFGLSAIAFFATAHLLRDDETARKYRYPAALWFAGGALVFLLLNLEIADAYSTGQTVGFHMGASLGEDMTYSLGWGVFGLLTLVVGMLARSTQARLSALFVLLLTIGKVFLHDLWHLGALYRVGSMVGLAMALLAVSFLTQRFILRGDRS